MPAFLGKRSAGRCTAWAELPRKDPRSGSYLDVVWPRCFVAPVCPVWGSRMPIPVPAGSVIGAFDGTGASLGAFDRAPGPGPGARARGPGARAPKSQDTSSPGLGELLHREQVIERGLVSHVLQVDDVHPVLGPPVPRICWSETLGPPPVRPAWPLGGPGRLVWSGH